VDYRRRDTIAAAARSAGERGAHGVLPGGGSSAARLQADRAPSWIAGWCLATVALRVLHTWLYNNSGKSVFGQALFHAISNLSWQLFPDAGSHYDPRITGPILAILAVFVAVL